MCKLCDEQHEQVNKSETSVDDLIDILECIGIWLKSPISADIALSQIKSIYEHYYENRFKVK